jgi:hypothetical protein
VSTSAAATLRFARRDASHGAHWLRDAFGMLWAHRVRWLLLLLVYYVILVSIDVVPWVGPFVAPLLKPVFAVGFLAAAWSQERGEPPAVAHLFRGFRANLAALLPLGVVLVAGMTGAVVATSWIDGGKVLEVLSGTTRPDEALLRRGEVQGAMLFGALCALPVARPVVRAGARRIQVAAARALGKVSVRPRRTGGPSSSTDSAVLLRRLCLPLLPR